MAGKSKPEIKITTHDDLFKTEEQRQEERAERVREIPLAEVEDFPDHPFHVTDGDEMAEMVRSIKAYGVLTPAIVRQKADGRYELVSGHRRKRACELAGLETLPVIVKQMSRDEAVIFMVDANLQREHILPSEKAFAYKMKLVALAHQGQTCGRVGHKSRDEISESDSGRQIQRYICLTNLIPDLLQMVDDKKIAFHPAVELSYLSEAEQKTLHEAITCEDRTPSLSPAQRMKRMSQEGLLNEGQMLTMLREDKPNQKEQVRIPMERINKYLPRNATARDAQAFIEKAIVHYARTLERRRSEPER